MSQADRPPSAVQPADVLRLWLGAHPLERAAMQRVQAQWFRKDEAFDAGLRQHFLPTNEAARDGRLDDWTQSAEGRLALIIVLDQFTRNVFRGQPASFAADAQALALAVEGIERGHDQAVPPMARIFCYLPLEHAEDAAMQHRSLALFGALARETGDDTLLVWARKHADVIFRFGRYPHRNAVLGRASTPEEVEFLAQPGSRF